MALKKEQKQKIIEDLKKEIERQKIMIFVNFKSLKTKDFLNLKKELKENDCLLTVAKKTLLKIAFNEQKTKIDEEKLEGQVASVFGFKDEILPAKIVYQFSKEDKNLKILGGFFEGKFKETEEIIFLAKLSSKEEVLARLVGTISTPVSNLTNVLQGNIKGLIFALSAIKK
jgi:large subunit ribosomal protein L10